MDISPLKKLDHLYDAKKAKTYKKMTAYEKLIEELSATAMTNEFKGE